MATQIDRKRAGFTPNQRPEAIHTMSSICVLGVSQDRMGSGQWKDPESTMVRPDDAAPPKGAPALEMDLPDLAGELDALSEKIHQLAEKERALSRRLACRSPKREAENGTLSWANRRKANLSDLKVAKKRNQDLEDFCDHWMAWLRGGTLRSGADAVAVCRGGRRDADGFAEAVGSLLCQSLACPSIVSSCFLGFRLVSRFV
eukprot:s2641_g11.t1